MHFTMKHMYNLKLRFTLIRFLWIDTVVDGQEFIQTRSRRYQFDSKKKSFAEPMVVDNLELSSDTGPNDAPVTPVQDLVLTMPNEQGNGNQNEPNVEVKFIFACNFRSQFDTHFIVEFAFFFFRSKIKLMLKSIWTKKILNRLFIRTIMMRYMNQAMKTRKK